MDFENLKLNVIGYVVREWLDAQDEVVAGMSEADTEGSLRYWCTNHSLLEVCEISVSDCVLWWREYLYEQGE